MKTFKEAWAEKEAQGYQYGEDALCGVNFGWEIALTAMAQDEEAALAAAVVEAAEHCTAEGCTFSAWEGRYRAVKDACAALQAFREGRAK